MRRITSACLLQTMRFDTLNGEDPAQELEMFCKKLDMKKQNISLKKKHQNRAERCLYKSEGSTISIRRTDIWSKNRRFTTGIRLRERKAEAHARDFYPCYPSACIKW